MHPLFACDVLLIKKVSHIKMNSINIIKLSLLEKLRKKKNLLKDFFYYYSSWSGTPTNMQFTELQIILIRGGDIAQINLY